MDIVKVAEGWILKNDEGKTLVDLLKSNGYVLIQNGSIDSEVNYIIGKEQKKKEKLLRDWDDNRYQ